MIRSRLLGLFGLVAICGLVIGAAVYHLERDRQVFAALEEARYTVRQQKALLALSDRQGGSLEVHLARIPASDIAYDLVIVPRMREGE